MGSFGRAEERAWQCGRNGYRTGNRNRRLRSFSALLRQEGATFYCFTTEIIACLTATGSIPWMRLGTGCRAGRMLGFVSSRWTTCANGLRLIIMDEKRFYDEKEETKQMPLVCPHCRQENSYPVRWMVRTKRAQIPGGANDQDRDNFKKARSYMVRVDNLVACRNIKCRKRFDLTGQTVFLI